MARTEQSGERTAREGRGGIGGFARGVVNTIGNIGRSIGNAFSGGLGGRTTSNDRDNTPSTQTVSDRQDFQLDSYLSNSGQFNRASFGQYIDPSYSSRQQVNEAGQVIPQMLPDKFVKAIGALHPLGGLALSTVNKLADAGIIDTSFKSPTGDKTQDSGDNDNVPLSPKDVAIAKILDNSDMSQQEKQEAVQALLDKGTAGVPVGSGKTGETPVNAQALYDAAYKNGVDPQAVFEDPAAFLGDGIIGAEMPMADPNAEGTNLDPSKFGLLPSQVVDPVTGQVTTAQHIDPKTAQGYDAQMTLEQIMQNGQATAAQGTVSDQALMEAQQLDQQGTATGTNADGSVNYTGQALNVAAQQGIASVIDTSTPAGKMLAQELGEGNYTDAKATMAGQMEILSKQFVGPDGEPRIPSWAAGTARNVSRIAAFKGMTGTAATAAMSQAIMEASLPMAQQDAQFFQTTTLKNLDNRQQTAINKANVLARLDLANLDARTAAATQNAQAFLQMDLKNLDNRQQAEIVNTQARVQSILEDAKAENAARLFGAQSANDFTKFYDQLGQQINMFNAEQKNSMEQFNVGQINTTNQFNSKMEQDRQQFYQTMQYNVDLSNAKWRQTVETDNTSNLFEAAQLDVQNLFKISTESMSQMWDREDALYDYSWKSHETEQNRDVSIYNGATDRRKVNADKDEAFGAGLFEAVKWATPIVKDIWNGDFL